MKKLWIEEAVWLGIAFLVRRQGGPHIRLLGGFHTAANEAKPHEEEWGDELKSDDLPLFFSRGVNNRKENRLSKEENIENKNAENRIRDCVKRRPQVDQLVDQSTR